METGWCHLVPDPTKKVNGESHRVGMDASASYLSMATGSGQPIAFPAKNIRATFEEAGDELWWRTLRKAERGLCNRSAASHIRSLENRRLFLADPAEIWLVNIMPATGRHDLQDSRSTPSRKASAGKRSTTLPKTSTGKSDTMDRHLRSRYQEALRTGYQSLQTRLFITVQPSCRPSPGNRQVPPFSEEHTPGRNQGNAYGQFWHCHQGPHTKSLRPARDRNSENTAQNADVGLRLELMVTNSNEALRLPFFLKHLTDNSAWHNATLSSRDSLPRTGWFNTRLALREAVWWGSAFLHVMRE